MTKEKIINAFEAKKLAQPCMLYVNAKKVSDKVYTSNRDLLEKYNLLCDSQIQYLDSFKKPSKKMHAYIISGLEKYARSFIEKGCRRNNIGLTKDPMKANFFITDSSYGYVSKNDYRKTSLISDRPSSSGARSRDNSILALKTSTRKMDAKYSNSVRFSTEYDYYGKIYSDEFPVVFYLLSKGMPLYDGEIFESLGFSQGMKLSDPESFEMIENMIESNDPALNSMGKEYIKNLDRQDMLDNPYYVWKISQSYRFRNILSEQRSKQIISLKNFFNENFKNCYDATSDDFFNAVIKGSYNISKEHYEDFKNERVEKFLSSIDSDYSKISYFFDIKVTVKTCYTSLEKLKANGETV